MATIKEVIACCMLLVFCQCLHGQDSIKVYDIIQLKNNTILRGEFKKLTQTQVTFDEDVVGDIKIDLEDVIRIKAIQGIYEVRSIEGKYLLGILDSVSQKEILLIRSFTGNTDTIGFAQIYSIIKLEKAFWQRFSGYLALGGSYTKNSGVGRLDLNSEINYRESKSILSLVSYLTLTTEASGENTQRAGVTSSYTHLMQKRYQATGLVSYERNTQLGFNGRINVSGFIGRNFNKKYYTEFIVATGLNNRVEWDLNGDASPLNVDFAIYLKYQLFEVGNSNISFSVDNTFFQQLGSNRKRDNFNFNMSWEIINDLDLLITNYVNYDSRPATEDSDTLDWGFTFSLKYSL
jgi:hypothetical protein